MLGFRAHVRIAYFKGKAVTVGVTLPYGDPRLVEIHALRQRDKDDFLAFKRFEIDTTAHLLDIGGARDNRGHGYCGGRQGSQKQFTRACHLSLLHCEIFRADPGVRYRRFATSAHRAD